MANHSLALSGTTNFTNIQHSISNQKHALARTAPSQDMSSTPNDIFHHMQPSPTSTTTTSTIVTNTINGSVNNNSDKLYSDYIHNKTINNNAESRHTLVDTNTYASNPMEYSNTTEAGPEKG